MNQTQSVQSKISADVPDWSREQPQRFWDPGCKLVRAIRRYQQWHQRGSFVSLIISKFFVLPYHFWSIVTGADIPLNCEIGGGLWIPHPNGIVIHPGAKIGVNCLIFQQVTIGTGNSVGVPILGGHVDVGAGAKILGPVNIGDHAKIGANAVVSIDIPAHALAVGVPAKIIERHAKLDQSL